MERLYNGYFVITGNYIRIRYIEVSLHRHSDLLEPYLWTPRCSISNVMINISPPGILTVCVAWSKILLGKRAVESCSLTSLFGAYTTMSMHYSKFGIFQ